MLMQATGGQPVRINQSFEQGVVCLLMLSLQKDGRAVGSETLSELMDVSDSYLKKTLRKLVLAGLVESRAGRDGGFVLARPIDRISLGDAFRALDPDAFVFSGSKIAEDVFEGCSQLDDSEWRITRILDDAGKAFMEKLDTHPLTELLRTDTWVEKPRDWASEALKRKGR